MYTNIINGGVYDSERALYNLTDTSVIGAAFAGPADGESALKEARNIELVDCSFSLRYPLWHTSGFRLSSCTMDELTRAALWYSDGGFIENSTLGGIKALRECRAVALKNCKIVSPEFGWKCEDISIEGGEATAEYFMFESRNVAVKNLKMQGKYSFQYIENMTIENSVLDTKDAFWHSKNVTVKNSTVKGEYLAWYSENLTLINCKIIGTQPLCYCKNLKLVDCTTEGCDLSFEYSSVDAKIIGSIDSVKNPHSGKIVADKIGEVISENSVMQNDCEIIVK